MRVNVYVDGFNLYYRELKGGPYKWLDLGALSRLLLPAYTLNRIRYFTARVMARPDDPQQPARQEAYLRALRTLPNLSIHLGQFYVKPKWMKLVNPPVGGPDMVQVHHSEEKGSDVNIATYLMLDSFRKDCDAIALISNDSDLTHTVEVVRKELGTPVILMHPTRTPAFELKKVANLCKPIRQGVLAASQFAMELPDAHGTVKKPPLWRTGVRIERLGDALLIAVNGLTAGDRHLLDGALVEACGCSPIGAKSNVTQVGQELHGTIDKASDAARQAAEGFVKTAGCELT